MRFEYSDYYRKLGYNIYYYRRDRGFTQEALGEVLDIEPSHVSKIERAVVGVSLDMLFAIAAALDVPPSKLLEFRD